MKAGGKIGSNPYWIYTGPANYRGLLLSSQLWTVSPILECPCHDGDDGENFSSSRLALHIKSYFERGFRELEITKHGQNEKTYYDAVPTIQQQQQRRRNNIKHQRISFFFFC